MLYNTARYATPYAVQLQSKGIQLSVGHNSHLNALVSHSYMAPNQATISLDEFIQNIQNATIMQGGVTEYENYLHTMVDELSELVQTHVKVAREVGQLCKEFTEIVRRYMDNAPSMDASTSFNIVKDDLGDMFQEPSISNDIGNAPTQMPNYIFTPTHTGFRTLDNLLDMLLTGNTNLDSAIRNTLTAYGDNFLENIWEGIFTNQGFNSPYHVSKLASIPASERLTVAYLAYLMSQKCYDNIPEDAVGTLSTYQRNVADLRDYLYAMAGMAYDDRVRQMDKSVVVVSFNPSSKTAVVNGDAYRKWLNEGGAPEIILGALLSDCGSSTAEQLNLNASRYLTQWNGYCVFHNAERDVSRARFMRSIYHITMTELFGKVLPFEEEFRKSNTSFAENVLADTVSYVEDLGLEDLQKVEQVALELVAGKRFSYTPSLMILNDIDSTLKASPEADVREAALVASCNYIALYLAGQLTVNKV